MEQSIRFFDEVAHVGKIILDCLGANPTPQVKKYLKDIADIYNLLAQIHDDLALVAVDVSLAKDLNEVDQALEGVGQATLSKTFRVRLWCDDFARLGQTLRPLGQEVALPAEDRQFWNEFCTTLEQQEMEVARIYDTNLYEFSALASSGLSLQKIKEKAESILNQLIAQKIQFDLLAKQAAARRRRLH